MTQHTNFSTYREKLIEHLFVGELLKISWLHHNCAVEIAKPEVDNSGYDIIADSVGFSRHIQIKTSMKTGKAAYQKVHAKLAEKPSACVLWILFDEKTMELGPYKYFGGDAGEKMPSLSAFKIAKHTKGNKEGFKAERPNLRVIPKGSFVKINSIEDVYRKLFEEA